MSSRAAPIHVSLVAIPESLAFPLTGIYETLQILGQMGSGDIDGPTFKVEIVGREQCTLQLATGLPITVQRDFRDVERTDVVIATSMNAGEHNEWVTGRHPEAVTWLRAMHRRGAVLCSSCTGVLLLAETGLLEGLDATIHWAYAPTFRRNFPGVRLQLREVLLTGGARREFVMAGATSSWQDLVLYLVTRCTGPDAAQAIGKFMLFQWHADTQAPYVSFVPPTDHGDAVIREIQGWLAGQASSGGPLEELVKRSGLSETTFKRRFKHATGYSPLHYVQHLRVEEAKRRLERTDTPIDEISWQVGYENPAFFRRLFKRTTRLTPGEYRRKFRIPEFAKME
ncbi:MAG: GlxA family transcriptional regulator [Dehalococcoidia bacterium]